MQALPPVHSELLRQEGWQRAPAGVRAQVRPSAPQFRLSIWTRPVRWAVVALLQRRRTSPSQRPSSGTKPQTLAERIKCRTSGPIVE